MKMNKNNLLLIRLVEDDFHYWHYVEVSGLKSRLLKDIKSGTKIDVKNYGNVIKSGFGHNPPQSLHAELEKTYGVIEIL